MVILAIMLFVNAGFNAIVWPQFYRRVSKDSRARDANGKATPFLVVHAVLIALALTIAFASLLLGISALTGLL